MTFLEAAIEILKRERQPLHYKKLTQLAIDRNLLTVIGRTPEITMQQRLNDALKKHDPALLLTREKPGVFGLRYYPPSEAKGARGAPEGKAAKDRQQAPAEKAAATARSSDRESSAAASGPDDDKQRRRRRGTRGRRRGGEEGGAAPPDAAAIARRGSAAHAPEESDEGAEALAAQEVAEISPAEEEMASAPPDADNEQPEAPEEELGGREGTAGTALEPIGKMASEAAPAREPSPVDGDVFPSEAEDAEAEPGEDVDRREEPLLAPTLGSETLFRSEGQRPSFEGKGRHHPAPHGQRGRERERPRPEGATTHPGSGPGQRGAAQGRTPYEGRTEPPRGDRPTARAGAVEAVIEVLRSGDGRPWHIRQIVDLAIKRRLLRGNPPELWRSVGLALLADQRTREAAGLRPRVRSTGGGHYVLSDHKLEGDLNEQERTLTAATARLSSASRVALRRRLVRLAPPAFESFGRLLLERLGFSDAEPIKRGDGVAYYGGTRTIAGGQRRKVLIALRPGESEFGRRAVTELLTGLKARGFDQGLLLAAGPAAADVSAERSPGTLEIYDGEGLVELCAKHDLGILRRAVVVDLLDVELLGELEA
jgi:hypothetical protein